MYSQFFYKSPIGRLVIQVHENKIYSISKGSLSQNKPVRSCFPECVQKLQRNLDQYFSGQKTVRWNVSLSSRGTPFQNKVWRYLAKIPYGSTRSYSQAAQALGCPKAFRAVGAACGKNPWLIVIPCHRMTAKNGWGGFALGLKVKSYLINHESKGIIDGVDFKNRRAPENL